MQEQKFSISKIVAALLMGYGCAAAWVIYADRVYHNQVPLEAFEFHGLYPVSLGVSAILAALVFGKSLKGIGFTRFSPRYLFIAIGIAVLVLAVPFGINISTGIVGINSTPRFDMELMKVGIPVLIVLAIGEEVMWRGVLYNEFSKKFSFVATSFIIGLFWVIWHLPVIIHTRFIYADRPLSFALLAFPVSVMSSSFIYNYLRLISRNLWPVVFLHAFTNYFAFLFIEPFEKKVGPASVFFINDIGIFYVLANLAGAIWVVNKVRKNSVQ